MNLLALTFVLSTVAMSTANAESIGAGLSELVQPLLRSETNEPVPKNTLVIKAIIQLPGGRPEIFELGRMADHEKDYPKEVTLDRPDLQIEVHLRLEKPENKKVFCSYSILSGRPYMSAKGKQADATSFFSGFTQSRLQLRKLTVLHSQESSSEKLDPETRKKTKDGQSLVIFVLRG